VKVVDKGNVLHGLFLVTSIGIAVHSVTLERHVSQEHQTVHRHFQTAIKLVEIVQLRA